MKCTNIVYKKNSNFIHQICGGGGGGDDEMEVMHQSDSAEELLWLV